ncbi:hypothetical protein NGG04_12820 [Mammaliicoccus sciuri]|uniref:sigma factor-like helix-turn-helix DNA-binding protein n=1 Tax=Mammaliicoccus sciuri TaxID=1296 RepID=UPI002DB5F647|nr:sigma factor-like helix-turn-helix DNA-binding protein [Mammaliicoccus sciuri]MEB7404975.1 hypothetical protein [Mammaliicoccus sciuri]MEB8312751.1 hypothetical protein [Mammaliicoccus sciuri]
MSLALNELKEFKWYRMSWIHEYLQLEAECSTRINKLIIVEAEYERWRKGDLFYKNKYLTVLSKQKELLFEVKRIENELNKLKTEMNRIKEENNLTYCLENRILIMKYTDKKTLKQISNELGYSESYIRRRHAQIKKKLKI